MPRYVHHVKDLKALADTEGYEAKQTDYQAHENIDFPPSIDNMVLVKKSEIDNERKCFREITHKNTIACRIPDVVPEILKTCKLLIRLIPSFSTEGRVSNQLCGLMPNTLSGSSGWGWSRGGTPANTLMPKSGKDAGKIRTRDKTISPRHWRQAWNQSVGLIFWPAKPAPISPTEK